MGGISREIRKLIIKYYYYLPMTETDFLLSIPTSKFLGLNADPSQKSCNVHPELKSDFKLIGKLYS